MTDTLEMVRKFHKAFDLSVADKPYVPQPGAYARRALYEFSLHADDMAKELLLCAPKDESGLLMRLHLCMEELGELAKALTERDPVATLDALADMRYVADGAILHLGFADVFAEAMDEVHASNMSKLVDGKPVKNDAGRVLKPETYFKPDLFSLAYSGMEPA